MVISLEQRRRQREDDAALDLRGGAVHVDDVAAVHRRVDVRHLAAARPATPRRAPLRRRWCRSFRRCAMPRPSPGGQRRAPAGHRRRLLERRLEARLIAQQVAPELERILAGRVRHLVDERLLEEAVLRVEHRSPLARAGSGASAFLLLGVLLGDRVRHEHRLAVAAAGVVRVRGERHAVRVQRAGMARHRRAAVVVVLDVVLARPDRLHRRRRHRLRDARAEVDVVEVERQPPAEAAAEHEVREAARSRRRCRAPSRRSSARSADPARRPTPRRGRLRPSPCTPSAPSSRARETARGSRR